MTKTFKTPKGTELPLINLKGKDYLQVQHRLVWFREEKPDWSIDTEFLAIGDESATAKATISNAGMLVATAHKQESAKHFADFLEKAETGAIGRALAHCGYGTQFAQELEEGERIVDAPAPPKSGAPLIQTGVHKGRAMSALSTDELIATLNLFEADVRQQGKTPQTLSPHWKLYHEQITSELQGRMK